MPGDLLTKHIKTKLENSRNAKQDKMPKVQALCQETNGNWGPCENDNSFSRIIDTNDDLSV